MVILYNATGGWPVRWANVLASTKNASRAVRNNCGSVVAGEWVQGTLIIDSDFNNPNTTNETILKKASCVRADYIVPKDYPGEDYRATIDSIMNCFKEHKLELCGPNAIRMMVPLQPDSRGSYEPCFLGLKPLISEGFTYFGLGGLVSFSRGEQLRRIRDGTKLLASHHLKTHLFGIYPKLQILQFIYKHQEIIYSLDTTVMEAAALLGRILDMNLQPHPVGKTLGEGSTKMRYRLAEYNLEMVNAVLNNPQIGKPTKCKGGPMQEIKTGRKDFDNNHVLEDFNK